MASLFVLVHLILCAKRNSTGAPGTPMMRTMAMVKQDEFVNKHLKGSGPSECMMAVWVLRVAASLYIRWKIIALAKDLHLWRSVTIHVCMRTCMHISIKLVTWQVGQGLGSWKASFRPPPSDEAPASGGGPSEKYLCYHLHPQLWHHHHSHHGHHHRYTTMQWWKNLRIACSATCFSFAAAVRIVASWTNIL